MFGPVILTGYGGEKFGWGTNRDSYPTFDPANIAFSGFFPDRFPGAEHTLGSPKRGKRPGSTETEFGRLYLVRSGYPDIEQEGSQWLLTDGRSRMKLFEDRDEAERTVEIIQHYGMNDQCFIGRPDSSLEYWLVDGRAPTGSMPGEDCVGFDPTNLEVRQRSSDLWLLVDGDHSLYSFPNEAEAQQARTIIQEHQFDRACFVGRPDASMTYLRRSDSTPERSPTETPTTEPPPTEPPPTEPPPGRSSLSIVQLVALCIIGLLIGFVTGYLEEEDFLMRILAPLALLFGGGSFILLQERYALLVAAASAGILIGLLGAIFLKRVVLEEGGPDE